MTIQQQRNKLIFETKTIVFAFVKKRVIVALFICNVLQQRLESTMLELLVLHKLRLVLIVLKITLALKGLRKLDLETSNQDIVGDFLITLILQQLMLKSKVRLLKSFKNYEGLL